MYNLQTIFYYTLLLVIITFGDVDAQKKKKKNSFSINLSRDGQGNPLGVLGLTRKWKHSALDIGATTDFGRNHRANLGFTHKKKNFEFNTGLSTDFRRNHNFNVGFKWRFGKRSADLRREHIKMTVYINPCYFHVYDKNDDGFITKPEMQKLFGGAEIGDTLFNALDYTTGDGLITKEEFDFMSPIAIEHCAGEL